MRMIRHTVAFRLVHPAGSAEETDFLQTAAVVLPAIPGVDNFAVWRQVSAKSDLTFHFAMDFADQQAYDAYNGHAVHTSFVETRWVPEVADFQELDLVRY